MDKRFYFTAHPGDLLAERLPRGCRVMLVAAAHWDEDAGRFRVARPPAGHVESIVIDSGGFTAARRWGAYPWTPRQYADWINETIAPRSGAAKGLTLDWCAVMDYACERGVNRETHRTNRERIKATIRNEIACREAGPDLPWLPVLQGDTLEERAFDLALRGRLGMVPRQRAGVGSVCGRGARAAAAALRFYRERLPNLRLHAFGLDVRALDDPAAWGAVESWDSYGWTWAPGAKGKDRPADCLRRPGETWSAYVGRLARRYERRTVGPRLQPPGMQLTFF